MMFLHTTRTQILSLNTTQTIAIGYNEHIAGIVAKPRALSHHSSAPSEFAIQQDVHLVIVRSSRYLNPGEPLHTDHIIHVLTGGAGVNAEHLHYIGSVFVNSMDCYTVYEEIQNL